MEKSPAACAMDWSIQLEKKLRSKIPGKSTEALEEIGRRLEWWNSKPELSSAEYRMLGLIPGEDKLFLNAIFLRLSDAFRLGSKDVKIGVVKLFARMKRMRKRDREGILSKGKLENYLELLIRVKEVFDKGDGEERVLALLLFGCWAYFAKDCADVRYTVLSSLVTGDVREVKAALFAAGCLSELSDDFANVFLEILTTLISSREYSNDVKLTGGRAFAKIWCPFSLADKAYKTGLKLLMDSSDDHFSALMLISLSRIASRWMLLVPTQIELLNSFQSEDRSFHMQAASLRCYHIIFARGVCNLPSTTDTFDKLTGILHRRDRQFILQLEALRVLHKILLFHLSTIPGIEISELFFKLLPVVKFFLRSPVSSTRGLAVSVLDLFVKFLGRMDMVSGGTGRTLASHVISFVLDHIIYLVTSKADIHQTGFDAKYDSKTLLKPLFNLVEEKQSYLHCLVLSNICLFIDKLMKMLKDTDNKTGLFNHGMVEFDNHASTQFVSNLMLYISKVIVSCLQNLEEINSETSQVLDALKLQLQNVCSFSYFFGSRTRMTYFLLSHLLSTRDAAEDLISLSINSSVAYVYSCLEVDKLTLDCARNMFERNNYWYLYETGKTAACQGAWSTSAFIFEQLVTAVRSASCSCWLKSLAQFSIAENQIRVYLLTDRRGDSALSSNYCEFTKNLLVARDALFSAREILAASDIGRKTSFQISFLTIRAATLKNVVDMIKLLDSSSRLCSTSRTLGPLLRSSVEVSLQLNKLAREFDLLSTSFMGMDRQSSMSISALAFSCSLMAFAVGLAFQDPKFPCAENIRMSKFGKSEDPFQALLIEDLFGRLTHAHCETRKSLVFLMKSFKYKGGFSGRLRKQITYTSYEAIILHELTEYCVREILGWQSEANGAQQDGEALSRILSNGSRLLSNVIFKLMSIPFCTPRLFFRVRPVVSSEIIVMNEDGQTINESSISSGFSLSLNLCFQLKNMPSGPPGPLKKAYCILNCTSHSQKTTEIEECHGQARSSRPDQETDDLLDLNEKLLRYVVGSAQTRELHRGPPDGHLTVNQYVSFELDERGQGFSTSFLDVSSFPVGSYRIKWQSGCIDGGGSYWSLLPGNVNSSVSFTIRDVAPAR